MKRFHVHAAGFLMLFLAALAPGARAADYIGDTLIYSATAAGVTPNVLLIIDNSKATLNTASGEKYLSGTVYENHGFQPWTIYKGDNQGDFSQVAVAQVSDSDTSLSNLTCTANNDIIRTTLLASGTYSGSGTSMFPNIKNGGCDTAPKGAYYALGNYLNYLQTVAAAPVEVATPCDPPPRVKACKNMPTNYNNCGYFELITTHTAAVNPAAVNSADAPNWNQYATAPNGLPGAGDPPLWVSGTTYTMPVCETGPVPSEVKTQRQVVYEALETVLGGARGSVNFGAMTYGSNNSGGKVVYDMADLSGDTAFNAFLTAIPGPGATDGEPVLSSNTGRPQAESLYDAGYYFGATYAPTEQGITNTSRIPEAIANDCGFNHIILITNGLSNGDGSPKLVDNIGDADGDGYPTEDVYGLGSHFLDDTARYLKETYGITTHTVLAFQAEDALVRKAAAEGGGQFYNVFNEEELAEALTKLLASIVLETDSAFVAPVVPTNPENRTFSGQRVYLGFFYPKTQQEWYGNLKKFGINHDNEIVDKNGNKAICPDARDTHCSTNDIGDGNFRLDAVSYWGTSTDGGSVEAGGAGARLLGMSSRNIYTYLGTANKNLWEDANKFLSTNTDVTSTLLGVADDTEKDKLINFVHGKNAYAPAADLNGDTFLDNTEKREWIMGDILHSKPQVVSYTSFDYANEHLWDYNKTIIYVGGNDGMLHAIKDCNGEELWSFIPPALLGKLKNLPGTDHNIFVDASPTAYKYDADGDGNIEAADGDKVILVFGLRRGGSAYYALDVTNPIEPKFLWEITPSTTGFGELGQSWSEPQFARVKVGTEKKIVALVGAGYDHENEDRRFGNTQTFTGNVTDPPGASAGNTTSTGTATAGVSPKGRGVFAFKIADLDAATEVPTIPASPVLVWKFTASGSTVTTGAAPYNQQQLTYAFPADVAPVDTDFDGYIDRLYIGDTGGRMWRISDYETNTTELKPLANPNISTWFGKIIFNANLNPVGSNVGRKIFYRPSVLFENGYIGVYFGTGDREHPLNTVVVDRLYAVYDRGQRTALNIQESNLEDVTEDLLQAATPVADPETCASGSDAIKCILERLRSASNYGWFIRMDTSFGALAGEKILAPALVFNKVAYFTTYSPNIDAETIGCVGNLGSSRLWAVNYKTGEAVFNFNTGNDTPDEGAVTNERSINEAGTVVKDKTDRYATLGVGIPSGLVIVINASGEAQVLIGCGGGICGGESMPGGTIFPVYWMPW